MIGHTLATELNALVDAEIVFFIDAGLNGVSMDRVRKLARVVQPDVKEDHNGDEITFTFSDNSTTMFMDANAV